MPRVVGVASFDSLVGFIFGDRRRQHPTQRRRIAENTYHRDTEDTEGIRNGGATPNTETEKRRTGKRTPTTETRRPSGRRRSLAHLTTGHWSVVAVSCFAESRRPRAESCLRQHPTQKRRDAEQGKTTPNAETQRRRGRRTCYLRLVTCCCIPRAKDREPRAAFLVQPAFPFGSRWEP